jgi:drug/metabolite transporter (DMT)-like permease
MTAILSRIVYKERVGWVKAISIGLSLVGMIFVSGAQDPATWQINAAGIIFGLLTGLCFAVYNLEGKHASDEHIDSWTALLYSFAIATFFLFFFNLGLDLFSGKPAFSEMLWLGNSVSGWGILFFLGVAPTLGGFGLYTMSMRFIPATSANLVATLEPVMTAVWAYFFLSEMLTVSQMMGGLLILVGVIILRASEK